MPALRIKLVLYVVGALIACAWSWQKEIRDEVPHYDRGFLTFITTALWPLVLPIRLALLVGTHYAAHAKQAPLHAQIARDDEARRIKELELQERVLLLEERKVDLELKRLEKGL